VPINAIEGVRENGNIGLHGDVAPPENARVYVIVRDTPAVLPKSWVRSPRLANPRQASDLRKRVVEEVHAAEV